MRRLILAFIFAVAFIGSPAMAKKKHELTPLELQSIQSKEFEADKTTVFDAVMIVVQDQGYIVQSADLTTGFITAYSPTENKTGFFEALGGVTSSGNTRMTAFIMRMPGKMTRVRLNFLNSKNSSSSYGQQSQTDKPILDPAVYTNAWDKIDEEIFILASLSEGDEDDTTSTSQSNGEGGDQGESSAAHEVSDDQAPSVVPASDAHANSSRQAEPEQSQSTLVPANTPSDTEPESTSPE